MPLDILPERTSVKPESASNRIYAFRRGAVQMDGFSVFLHATSRNGCLSLPGIEFRLMLFQVTPEGLRMQAELCSDLSRRQIVLLQLADGFGVLGASGGLVSPHL